MKLRKIVWCGGLASVLCLLAVSPAFAEGGLTITVATDKRVYGHGEVIVIMGEVMDAGQPLSNVTVAFELTNLSGSSTFASGFMTTNSGGAYSKNLTVGGFLLHFSPTGSYKVLVSVTAGSETASSSASFQVVPEFPYSAEQMTFIVSIIASLLILTLNGSTAQNTHGGLHRKQRHWPLTCYNWLTERFREGSFRTSNRTVLPQVLFH
jgi:hypothetical protein